VTGESHIPIAILAGGKSVRMGTDKAFIEVEGKTMIERTLDAANQCSGTVIIIANDTDKYASFGVPVYPDKIPGMGPLSGLFTAFEATKSDAVMIAACDMPFISSEVISLILGSYENGCGAVIPFVDGREQGLCAVYEKSSLDAFRERIEKGTVQFNEFRLGIRKKRLDETLFRQVDAELRSFMNVNTREELGGIG